MCRNDDLLAVGEELGEIEAEQFRLRQRLSLLKCVGYARAFIKGDKTGLRDCADDGDDYIRRR